MSSSRMGRNPFQKATPTSESDLTNSAQEPDDGVADAELLAMEILQSESEIPARVRSPVERIAESVLVDLPAQAAVLGLKALMLVRRT